MKDIIINTWFFSPSKIILSSFLIDYHINHSAEKKKEILNYLKKCQIKIIDDE
jgi:hypothetical protein